MPGFDTDLIERFAATSGRKARKAKQVSPLKEPVQSKDSLDDLFQEGISDEQRQAFRALYEKNILPARHERELVRFEQDMSRLGDPVLERDRIQSAVSQQRERLANLSSEQAEKQADSMLSVMEDNYGKQFGQYKAVFKDENDNPYTKKQILNYMLALAAKGEEEKLAALVKSVQDLRFASETSAAADKSLADDLGTIPSETLRSAVAGLATAGTDVLSLVGRGTDALGLTENLSEDAYRAGSQVNQAAETSAPGLLNTAIRGTVNNLSKVMAAGLAGKAAVYTSIATDVANQAYQTAVDKGLGPDEAVGYALEQGGIEAATMLLFEKMGLGGLEDVVSSGMRIGVKSGLKQFMKRAGVTTLQEIPEELLAEGLQSVSSYLRDVDPNALDADQIGQNIAQVLLQTTLSAGAAESIRTAVQPKQTAGFDQDFIDMFGQKDQSVETEQGMEPDAQPEPEAQPEAQSEPELQPEPEGTISEQQKQAVSDRAVARKEKIQANEKARQQKADEIQQEKQQDTPVEDDATEVDDEFQAIQDEALRRVEEIESGKPRRMISEEAYKAAKKKLKETKFFSGVPAEDVKALATIGLYHFESGARKFASWSKQMVSEFGEQVKPKLRTVWSAMKEGRQRYTQAERDLRKARKTATTTRKALRQPVQKREVSEKSLLKTVLRREAKGAREGQEELSRSIKDMAKLAEDKLGQYTLTQQDYTRLTNKIAGIKTEASIQSAQNLIQKLARKYEVGPKQVTMSERDLLRTIMKRSERDSSRAYLESAKNTVAIHKDLAQYAKTKLAAAKGVTTSMQQRILNAVAKARTPAQQRYAVATVEAVADMAYRRSVTKTLKDTIKKARKLKLRPEFQTKLDDTIGSLAMTSPTARSVEKAKSLLRYMERQDPDSVEALSVPRALVDKAEQVMDRHKGTNLSDLPAEELETITQMVSAILRANELKNTMLFGRRAREAEQVAQDASTQIENTVKNRYASMEETGDPGGTPSILRRLKWENTLPEDFSIVMSGDDSNIVHQVLYQDLWESQRNSYEADMEAQDYLWENMDRIGIRRKRPTLRKWSRALSKNTKHADVTVFEFENGTRALTKAEQAGLHATLMQPYSRDLILNKKAPIELEGSTGGKAIVLTPADARMFLKNIDPQAAELANAVQHYFNDGSNLKAQINERSLEDFGFEIATEENYYPVTRSTKAEDTGTPSVLRQFVDKQLDHQSMFKERTGGRKPVVIVDIFKVFYQHVTGANAYIHKGNAVRNASMLLGDGQFKTTVRERFGESGLQYWKDLLRDFTGFGLLDSGATDAMLNRVIRGLHVAHLGVNPRVMLYQPVSLMLAATEIDAKYLAKNIHRGLSKSAREEMKQWSPPLAARAESTGLQILSAQVSVNRLELFLTGREGNALTRTAMKGIHEADMMAISVIWSASKDFVSDTQPNLSGDEYWKAVATVAERVVNRTQPTFDPLNMTPLLRRAKRTPWMKLFMMYTSQRSKNISMMFRAYHDTQKHRKGRAGKIAAGLIGSSFMIEVVRHFVDWDYWTAEEEPTIPDREEMANKPYRQLQVWAQKAKVDSSGTKEDLIARLEDWRNQTAFDKFFSGTGQDLATGTVKNLVGNLPIGGSTLSELTEQVSKIARGEDPNLYWSRIMIQTPATSLSSDAIAAITYMMAGRWRKAIDSSTDPIGAIFSLPTSFISGLSKDVLKWHIEPDDIPERGDLAYRLSSGSLIDYDRDRLKDFVKRGDFSKSDLIKALKKEYIARARARGTKKINTKALQARIKTLIQNLETDSDD